MKIFVIISLFVYSIFSLNGYVKPNIIQALESSDISARSYIVMDTKTNRVILSKAEHDKMEVASICKLMTIYITLENIKNGTISLDDSVFASTYATSMEGSRAYLDNDYYSVSDLLKSVIVASANDSAVVLAEYIAGTETDFVVQMNNMAINIGMNNTRYSNATGLPSIEQYSTSYDTAILLNKLYDNDIFFEFASIWMDTLLHPSGRETTLVNTNRLIKYYDKNLCGKTGFTDEAGYCLASVSSNNDITLTCVVLGSSNKQGRFNDSVTLCEEVFSKYFNDVLLSKDELIINDIKINKGVKNSINLRIIEDVSVLQNKDKPINYVLKYDLPYSMKAPIVSGDVIGFVELIEDGVVIKKYDIISEDNIQKSTYVDYIKDIVNRFGQNN